MCHDNVMAWKRFPRWWSFVRRNHPSLVYSSNKGSVVRALIFLWCQSKRSVDTRSTTHWCSIWNLQRLHRWSLGMDKSFHPIFYLSSYNLPGLNQFFLVKEHLCLLYGLGPENPKPLKTNINTNTRHTMFTERCLILMAAIFNNGNVKMGKT